MSKIIELTDEQYATLQSGESITIAPPKPKIVPWEPEGGDWYVGIAGGAGAGRSTARCCSFGNEFQSEADAIADSIAIRRRNRLARYRDEFAPGFEFEYGQENWSIWITEDGSAAVAWDRLHKSLTEIYFPEDVCRDLADKINSGEVVL